MEEEKKAVIELQWKAVQAKLKQRFQKVPDLNAVLFLIGIQELQMKKKKFSKEQKQDLMHVAVCKLLSQKGYYQLQAYDQDGWPHYEAVAKIPNSGSEEQELLLKEAIVEYFEQTNL